MRLKNLLIIANNFPNADNSYMAEIFVKEQIKYLKNYFQTVYVISPVAYGMERLRKTTYRDYQYDNVKVFFPKYFNVPFFYTHLRSMWVYLETKAMLKLIDREGIDFDLIHAHFTWPSGAVAAELKKFFNVPVVITEHTHVTLYKELERKNRYYIDTWKESDAIIRVSRKDIPLFIDSGVDSNNIFCVGNGYDSSKYFPISKEKARELLNLPRNIKLVLHISRLYKVKGQEHLIRAMADILKKRKNCICYIGGNGPEKEKLENQINELGIQDSVRLMGLIPDDKMYLWMNACDIFVFPSLSESFGIVQIEAMACGKPVVATYNGGSEEIITSEDYGFLVEPGNSQELAEKIEFALNKSWDEGKIINYTEQYRWNNIAEQIYIIYNKLHNR